MPDSEYTLREAREAIARVERECRQAARQHVTQQQHESTARLYDERLDRIRADATRVEQALGTITDSLKQARDDAVKARRFAIGTAVTVGIGVLSTLVAVLT